MRLYEINQRIEELTEEMLFIDTETGEIQTDDEKFNELQELVAQQEDKLEDIFLYIKNLASDIDALKAERDSFDKRIKRKTKQMERLLDWTTMLQKGKTFETDKVRVKYRKSQKVEIKDESLIPEKYIKFKTTKSPDKTAIKDVLKNGGYVEGAVLVERFNPNIE